MSPRQRETDAAVLERARRAVTAKSRLRWGMLTWGLMFLGIAVFFTFVGVRKIEGLEEEQLTLGFIYGLTLAVVWTCFGLAGAVCLGKFLVGFTADFRAQELLVRYHDRLRDLGQLPENTNGKPNAPAGGSQPVRSEMNQTSSSTDSRL